MCVLTQHIVWHKSGRDERSDEVSTLLNLLLVHVPASASLRWRGSPTWKLSKRFIFFGRIPSLGANRAERVMRTWKNHFIATLATASLKFPLTQWDRLIQHAHITLNCLLP